jgi:hypothetical protein
MPNVEQRADTADSSPPLPTIVISSPIPIDGQSAGQHVWLPTPHHPTWPDNPRFNNAAPFSSLSNFFSPGLIPSAMRPETAIALLAPRTRSRSQRRASGPSPQKPATSAARTTSTRQKTETSSACLISSRWITETSLMSTPCQTTTRSHRRALISKCFCATCLYRQGRQIQEVKGLHYFGCIILHLAERRRRSQSG